MLTSKAKGQFPDEFYTGTIDLLNRKQKLWKFLQMSGKQITQSMRTAYRSVRRDIKLFISADRIALL